MTLPTATTTRWQPLRLGLVDIFHYDVQEFWFRDGRLLLRGNNGTGKSKVLALTLPFLLDGDLSPHRVEPDGDPKKRMEWNLLLDGAFEERLGYTWIEFGRLTDGGDQASLTIGCGLKAVRGRGVADRWFFLTPQRVGKDLSLLTARGTALTRDRLEEALGAHGQVSRTAEAHRRAVDEHLFRLGADRYAALVDLLVQLRQPQLSKRPDEARLSLALTEALSPVDQAVLSDVAKAFHDLEQQREELTALRETGEVLAEFLTRYTRYARIAARRAAGVVRTAQSAYEAVGRSIAATLERVEGHTTALARSREERDSNRTRLAELRARRETLAGRPELKDLAAARGLSEQTEHAVQSARAAERRCEDAVKLWHGRAGSAREQLDTAVEDHMTARAALLTSAEVTGTQLDPEPPAPDLVVTAGPAGDDPDAPGRVDPAAALPRWQEATSRRVLAVRHVRGLAEAVARADAEVAVARRAEQEAQDERDEVADLVAEAEGVVAQQAVALVDEWRAYVAALRELEVPHPEDLGLPDWTRTLHGPNPAAAAVRTATTAAQARLATRAAALEADWRRLRDARELREAERRALSAGVVAPPPPHPARDAAGRHARPGAPLWSVVDVVDGVSDTDRAGVESALHAAGLLDAWLTPDGTLLDPGTMDVALIARPPVARSLLEVLAPAGAQRAVPATVVAAVLAGIALIDAVDAADVTDPDGEVWVSRDGGFGLGPLRGGWSSTHTEHLGAAARERARVRRLVEVEQEITALDEQLESVATAVATVTRSQESVAGEADGAPGDGALRDAVTASVQRRADLERARRRCEERQAALLKRRQGQTEAAVARDDAAADLGLPGTTTELDRLLAQLADHRTCLATFVGVWRDVLARADRHREAAQEADQAHLRLVTATRETGEARDRRAKAVSALATLEESIGATVADLQRRLTETQDGLTAAAADEPRLELAVETAVSELNRAQGAHEVLVGQQRDRAAERDEAVAAFHRFAATGLAPVAVPDVDLGTGSGAEVGSATEPTVRLARRVDQALADVDDSDQAWRRVQDDVTRDITRLQEGLSRHGHQAVTELQEDRLVVSVLFQGRQRSPLELGDLLAADVGHRERLLTTRERELLQEHLVNDVASHLQELITEAEAQVAHMNAELAERPTSTGMRLRLRWETAPDGPDGLAEARRRLLRQQADLWSPADREAVSRFLSDQIDRERVADPFGTWQEHLTRALDYRAWHRFVIERHQDGAWRSATGPASGGERVLTVSLPLFAAASAHYRSAHPHAPRLVLLDEAFAGVDDDSRAKTLGLLAAFDLDVVMTSEREWGFYASVPGIATHQLVRREGVDAVHVTTWEWDGVTAHQVDRAAGPASAPARSTAQGGPDGSPSEGEEGLF